MDMVTWPRCCATAYAESHCTSPSDEGHVEGIGWLVKRWKLEKGWGDASGFVGVLVAPANDQLVLSLVYSDPGRQAGVIRKQ